MVHSTARCAKEERLPRCLDAATTRSEKNLAKQTPQGRAGIGEKRRGAEEKGRVMMAAMWREPRKEIASLEPVRDGHDVPRALCPIPPTFPAIRGLGRPWRRRGDDSGDNAWKQCRCPGCVVFGVFRPSVARARSRGTSRECSLAH